LLVINGPSRPAACKTQDIRVARHALFSQQETMFRVIQQPGQNSPGSAPYSLHDQPQYRIERRVKPMLDRGEIARFNPAEASPKEAQSFPELRPITTLVSPEIGV
jgi:hypothetical protein